MGRSPIWSILFALLIACPIVRVASADTLTIGYVEIAGDERYEPVHGAERMILATRDRPFDAVEVALDEARPLSPVIHLDFAVTRITAKAMDEVVPMVLAALRDQNIHFFVLDLPADAVKKLAEGASGKTSCC